ncbi:MAG: T9SS type B sorting domain-containing protein, partial [Paludibacteraceae bacterium]|nr:T9SS type B sorting domain-containing protein [Paludibacteraceae bacterium]
FSDDQVKALYSDCSEITVTSSDATTGDDCNWTVTRTYTISDKCNNATTKTMSVSGSDKTVPELIGTWPKDIVDQDNCVANADITGLMSDNDVKALYKDCSTFEVSHTDVTTGDDCGWTVTRTYTIKDKCNNATTKTMSVSGSDKTVPELTGTRPEDISGQNTCFANADLSGLKDVDYIKGIYSDVCGDVNVTYSEEKNETDCGWSVKRTYLISDFCKNSVSTSVTVSGKDAEKPVITTTAVSGDKGCNPEIVAPEFTVTDNCDNNVQVQVTTTGVQGAGYKKTQTWTATAKDVCGNSAEPVVIVYTWIEDSSTPFAVQMPADMVICQGSSVKLIPTIQGDPTSFSWKQGGTEVSTDETYTATPNETTTYHFTAVANECISSSGSVTITVEDPISFDLNEKDLVICEGTSVSLEPINIQGDLAQAPYSWTKNGVVVSSAAKLTDTPSANATYELTISGNKCAKARKSVSVTVEKQPSLYLRLSDNEVCEDENVTLQVTYSNVLGLEWLSKGDSDSEFTVFANNLSATNEVLATNDIMYQVRSTGNQACPEAVSNAVALIVEPKMEISLPSEIAICSKDEKTIEATFSRTPTSIVWMVKNANAANYHQTKFTEAKIVVNPNVSSYYKVIASSKNCPTAEAEVLLKVEEIPNWEIISKTNIVCEGDEVELSTDLPSDYNFVWEAKTNGSANYERLSESSSKLFDSPLESTTYRLSVQSPAGCSAGSKLYDVKVDKPVYGSIADIAICDGDSGRLSVFVDDKSSYSYYWSDMPDYSNILSRQTSVRVAPKTTTSYYLKIVNGVCSTEYEAEVEVRTLPEIVGIEDMGNRMYRIQVEGGSVPYSYTWGRNSMPTSSDIMERPTYGMTYNVTVTDAIGCKVSDVVEVPTYELEIPEYFFPEFEKWKVKNLDRFYGSKVTIYDRFGKMLREYDVDQFNGWDGTYLGSPMPSTDYWYVISIQELDKELVGHFTLRRRNK